MKVLFVFKMKAARKLYTVQVRKLVDRESQEPLFNEFLWGDFVTFKTKFFYPNKIHSFRSIMVKKYFHKANILLNKLLQWNDLSQKCTVVKLGGHKLVQHVCSIGNSRLIRPKHPPHVAPTYDPNSLKSLVFLTNWVITHLTMGNSKMLWYEKTWVIIISWVHVFEKME